MVTILDGGMGRELLRQGAPFRMPEWSALALIERAEFVARAHRAFAHAGADVITTNSYALVPGNLGEARFLTDAQRLADLSGRLAREVADEASAREGRKVRVAGSLGPLFGSYKPGNFRADKAGERLAPLIKGLRPHVDLWLAETTSSIREAQAVAAALRGDARPLWISYTLNEWLEPDGSVRLRSGETVAAAVTAALGLGAAAVLFNCSPPEVMEAALLAARPLTEARDVHLGVYANAFADQDETQDAESPLYDIRPDLTPTSYGKIAESWRAAGADIIGGCCGIGPEHIHVLADRLGGGGEHD
jgi:S-methylmethionine-dependent homocysteine/selenocysteine methylase